MRRRTRVGLAVLLVVTSLAATAGTAARWLVTPVDDGVITLLLLGSDEGPPRAGTPERGRADAFHLLFVSPDREHATFVNIARDAWVPIADRGNGKINGCLAGGPDRCVRTVEGYFGIDVDHYLLTSMHGMAHAFEQFGGIDVEVDRALTMGGPDIAAGAQHLNGYEALTYARDRKNRPDGDFGRTRAQAELLQRAHAEAVAGADLGSIARAVAILSRHVVTDIPDAHLLRYGYAAMTLRPRNVANVTLPGTIGTAGAASVIRLGGGAAALVADAADDGRVTATG
ncbi:MAG: LCP family protein [Actinobacteria bacterium]|nr:LCP family protein [Actinomycetota bacterium]